MKRHLVIQEVTTYIFSLYELFNLVQDPVSPLQLFHNVFKSATYLMDGTSDAQIRMRFSVFM